MAGGKGNRLSRKDSMTLLEWETIYRENRPEHAPLIREYDSALATLEGGENAALQRFVEERLGLPWLTAFFSFSA